MRNYGTVRLSKDKKEWIIQCEPHVSMRLKQVFQRLEKSATRELRLTTTEENCRDLEWFLTRFPLEVDPLDFLTARARGYDQRVASSHRILDGSYPIPDFQMALPPREYQKIAALLTLNSGGLLLADELGLGKTVSALTLLSDPRALPAIVVTPAHLPNQWQSEIKRFLPGLRTHILKKGSPYPLVDKDGRNPDVIITSYNKLNGWAEHFAHEKTAKAVVYDEVQELRRVDSLKYVAARLVSDSVQYRLGLSATPIYNYGGEFHAVMDVVRPGCLGSREEFIREWCVHSFSDKPRIKDPKVFGAFLRDSALMLRRTRKDVSRELPSLSQVVHEIDCDPNVLKQVEGSAIELAKIILTQNKGWDVMKAASELSNTLRQATGLAKAPYVAEFVRMLLEQGTPVVLFGWHREVYSIWEERLAEFNPAWYTGTESPTQKQKEISRFLSGETNLLIMSLRSGSGVDGLQQRCATVVVGELDWSPGVLEQCLGRIHRDGQQDPVFAYFLTAMEGADPIMVDVLGLKRQQIEGVRDPNGEIVLPNTVDPDHVKKLATEYLKQRTS